MLVRELCVVPRHSHASHVPGLRISCEFAEAAFREATEWLLRVLNELGYGDSLKAEDADGDTPAHDAARKGHEQVLRVLHELGCGDTLKKTDLKGGDHCIRTCRGTSR